MAEAHPGADGGEGFVSRSWHEMGEAVRHPGDALLGAGKEIVNAFADVGALLLQGGALQGAGEMQQAAGYQALFGQSAQAEQTSRAADEVRAGASQIRIPDIPMTTAAQAGGDKVATVAMVVADGAGLAKGVAAGGAREGVRETGTLARGLNGGVPSVFDGEIATRKLLGTTEPPGGRKIMFHAADRMVNPPPGRAPMSPRDIDRVLDGATKIDKRSIHPHGETLQPRNANMPGSPRVVVDAATGRRVITVINPKVKEP